MPDRRGATPQPVRHTALVRITHWLTTVGFFALLVSGLEIVVSHPRFYWGEAGNVLTPALFSIPIPASRDTVDTGFEFVLPDQNGWSRSLHFEAAWLVVLTGLLYAGSGVVTRHFQRRLHPASSGEAGAYNTPQKVVYLGVIFILFPFVIWTGLAMSPAIASVFPSAAAVLGGQQSARTLHFFITVALVAFVVVHLVMIALAGFTPRVRAMLTGHAPAPEESA